MITIWCVVGKWQSAGQRRLSVAGLKSHSELLTAVSKLRQIHSPHVACVFLKRLVLAARCLCPREIKDPNRG